MKSHIGLLLLILLALGCKKGPSDYKEGRYGTNGGSSGTYGRVHITTVSGHKLDASGAIVGPEEHVLYFAISLPESYTGSSWMAKSEATRTVWYLGHAPKTGGGIHVEVVWDRAADVVNIEGKGLDRAGNVVTTEGKRFDRIVGNVFLIETDGKGNPVFRQNSKVRSGRVPEGEEARVIEEEFPHLATALKTLP